QPSGLPWTCIRFGPRSGQWYGPEPQTGAQAFALADDELTRLMRIWMANRGVWDALPGAGPTVPVPAARADIERYVNAYAELLAALTRPRHRSRPGLRPPRPGPPYGARRAGARARRGAGQRER